MASYQNGTASQIEGYNDCPIVDQLIGSKKQSGSSTSSIKSRRKRIVGHDLSGNTSPTASTCNSDSSVNIPKMAQTGTPFSMRKSNVSDTVGNSVVPEDISDETIREDVNMLLEKKSRLPHREFEHYTTKIKTFVNDAESLKKLSTSDKKVIHDAIVGDFETDGKRIKSKLMTLILNNEGFGSWCLPLIKIIENSGN